MAGSWVGDSIEEFKKAPTGGKVALVAIFVLVAGLGFYEYNKSKSSSSGVSGSASPSTDLTGGGGGANPYPVVPGSGQGQVPVLPGGFSALFDPLGNLIGWQPTPPPPTPSPARLPPVPGVQPTRPPKTSGKHQSPDQKDHKPSPITQKQETQINTRREASLDRRVQPPTGTPRGERPGPGQRSRPVPPQPIRRGPRTGPAGGLHS